MITIDHSRDALVKLLESAGMKFKGNRCFCIFHLNNDTPAAGVYEKNGAWRYKCQVCGAGGDLEDVRKLLGDRPAFTGNGKSNGNGQKAPGRIVCKYPYVDEGGVLLFEKVRYDPKDFNLRHPNGNGGYAWGMGGARRVLYRLPDLIAAPPETIIFLAEGEKDVDNLRAAGLVATTNWEGAAKPGQRQKWAAEYNEFFRNRIVAVLPDKDGPGRARADHIARQLVTVAREVRVFEVPENACKDASEYLSAGGDADGLMQLFDAAPVFKAVDVVTVKADEPETHASMEPLLTCMADVQPRPINWLWRGRMPLGRITLLVGMPGGGKSFLTMDIAARVSTGSPFPDGSPCPQGSVLLITAEDDTSDTIRPRLDSHRADVRHIHHLSAIRVTGEDGQKNELYFTLAYIQILEDALKMRPDWKLIIIDPIGSFLGGKTDAHRDNEVRGILAPVAALAEKYGAAVLIVAHRRKSAGDFADDVALGSRAFTGIARAVWHLCRDKKVKNKRYLLPGKNNLAAEGTGLAFTIGGDPGRIWWEHGPVDMNADDGLAAELADKGESQYGPEPKTREAAEAWLLRLLGNGVEIAAATVKDECAGAGINYKTVQRAADALDVVRYKAAFGGGWRWKLPAPAEGDTKGTKSPNTQPLVHLSPSDEYKGLSCSLDEGDRLYESGMGLVQYAGEPDGGAE